MVAVPEPTMLVCVACGRVVTTLRLIEHGAVQVEPCGHSAGYTAVPASTLEADAAA